MHLRTVVERDLPVLYMGVATGMLLRLAFENTSWVGLVLAYILTSGAVVYTYFVYIPPQTDDNSEHGTQAVDAATMDMLQDYIWLRQKELSEKDITKIQAVAALWSDMDEILKTLEAGELGKERIADTIKEVDERLKERDT